MAKKKAAAELAVEYVAVEELLPYKNNARAHGDSDVEAIMASIREFGFNDLIGVWKNIIVEGHGRLLAAKRMGLETVPVIRLDHLTDKQRKAYALAHNKTAELSGWDFDVLGAELADLADIDMSAFGFDVTAVAGEPEVTDDDYEVMVPDEPTAQRGQVWVLGSHRLMCGDSSSPTDVDILFDGGVKPKLVFTDPPYGVAIGDKNKMLDEVAGVKSGSIKTNIEGDTLSTEDLRELLLAAFTNLRQHCAEDCSYYVSSPQGGGIGLMMMMMMMMRDAGLEVRHNLIWEKSSATFSMGRLDYDYQHEPIFYTWTKKHNFYGAGKYKTTIWKFDKPRKCDLHPTMKPLELIGECILNSSKSGDVVADIFGGSGSTLIASEQLGRSCYMMEIDPKYCDVIIDRWETLTGKKAVLLSDKK